MAIHRMTLEEGRKPGSREIVEIEAASRRPVDTSDPDAPPLNGEALTKLAALAREQRARRRKQTVPLRLSPETLEKAKGLGEGYTSVLSRIIDYAMNDPDIVRKCL